MLGLLIAVAFRAWHALLPGHGKTLMAAAMVVSGARARQAIVTGVAVALMHTVAVIGPGFLVFTLEHAFRPEVMYPWLGVLSGVTAAAIGVHLFGGRWRAWRAVRSDAALSTRGHGDHDHVHDLTAGDLLSRRGIAALAFAGGILPAPSALLVMLAAIKLTGSPTASSRDGVHPRACGFLDRRGARRHARPAGPRGSCLDRGAPPGPGPFRRPDPGSGSLSRRSGITSA